MSNYGQEFCQRTGSAWTRFWFTPSDPIVLSLMRVLVGLLAIWWYLGFYADLQQWFGPNGLFTHESTLQLRTDETGTANFAISILDYVDSPSLLWAVYAAGLATLVLMTAGVFSRVTTILGFLFILSFIHRAPLLFRPVDDILAMLMFYLCIGPSGAEFSVDVWLKRRQEASNPAGRVNDGVAAFSSAATVAIRLMQVHLALIYASTAMAQLRGEVWWQGMAVWWMMSRPESRLVDLTFLHSMGLAFEYLVNFLTHAIVAFELCFALLIWNDLARPILLVLGLFVWAGLALVSGWVSLSVAMIIANLAFLRPETLRAWCAQSSVQPVGAADYV